MLVVLFCPRVSFAMLIAYKTSLSMIDAGAYRFSTFTRIGVPLMLGAWPIMSGPLPILYEL